MYDPSIGRWITEDPIGFDAGDMDLYRYVGNNPTNLTDPSGLKVKLYLSKALPSERFTVAYHVSIVVGPDSTGKYIQYDGGGEDLLDAKGRPIPKRTIIDPNNPNARHRALPKRETKDEVISTYKTSDEEIKKLDEVFGKLKQVPYKRLGPNSNTYVKQLLKLAGFKVVPAVEERLKEVNIGVPGMRVNVKHEVEVGATGTTGWYDNSYGGSNYDEWGNAKPSSAAGSNPLLLRQIGLQMRLDGIDPHPCGELLPPEVVKSIIEDMKKHRVDDMKK